ncbi:MAG TPA: GNAT family N-acetyltransferase [Terracidiphilus sp.]|nr:GNAT family N-acetyltransferase [Terracidiphilus sp.]
MFATRPASLTDAALITAHRRAMFLSMPNPNEPVLEEMSRHFEPWVSERLGDGRYVGWIAEEAGRVAGSAGLIILDWPPHALHPTADRRAYVLNVYVEPEFRKRGLAHQLLERCMAEARRRGIRVVTLHAAEAGRRVYEKFGFRPSNEMMYIEPEAKS